MKLNKKMMSGLIVSFAVMGCSTNVAPSSVNEIRINQSKLVEPETVYVAEVSENKGASLTFRIDTPNSGFATKANINGTVAKVAANVATYQVYLVKSTTTTAYPLNGDPIGATDRVAGPFAIVNSGAASKLVRFTNVPISTPSAYYVAIRAQDSGSVDIIKTNNGSATAWTGTTAGAPANGKVAISTGAGIIVDNAYAVNSTTALAVSVNLLDAVGAEIEANVTPNAGGTPPPIAAI